MKPLLVGEDNPYGGDPRYALYPEPPNSAGGRLCRLILGLTPKEYIRKFDRVNLCHRKWNAAEAREHASEIINGYQRTVVLLGKKVSDAFGLCPKNTFLPFQITEEWDYFGGEEPRHHYAILPHPSGRNRLWNEADAYERARRTLAEAGIDLSPWKPATVEEQKQDLLDRGVLAYGAGGERPALCANCHALLVAPTPCQECGPS